MYCFSRISWLMQDLADIFVHLQTLWFGYLKPIVLGAQFLSSLNSIKFCNIFTPHRPTLSFSGQAIQLSIRMEMTIFIFLLSLNMLTYLRLLLIPLFQIWCPNFFICSCFMFLRSRYWHTANFENLKSVNSISWSSRFHSKSKSLSGKSG